MNNMINIVLFIIFPFLQVLCKNIDIHKNTDVQPIISGQSAPDIQRTLLVSDQKNNHQRKFSDRRHNLQQVNRFRRSSQDLLLEPPLSWNYLRQYICGAGNQNCMYDERINKFYPDILRQLTKVSDPLAPIDIDWSSKEVFMPPNYSSDVNIWNSVNLSGRREGPLYVDEPRFVLLNEQDLYGNSQIDDPFIPQRGKKNNENDSVHNINKHILFNELLNRQYKRKLKPFGITGTSISQEDSNAPLSSLNNKMVNTLSKTAHINKSKNKERAIQKYLKWCCRDHANPNFHSHMVDEDNILIDNAHPNKRNLQTNNNNNNNLSQENRDTFYLTRGSKTHLNE